MVIDQGVYRSFDYDVGRVHEFCKDVTKQINALYKPLNVFVALTDVEIWSERNKAEISR